MVNRLLWIGMLGAVVALFIAFEDTLLQRAGTLKVTTEGVPADAVLFEWRGEVAPPMRNVIRKAFNEWGPKRSRIILSLHSPGGLLGEGDRVVRLLRQIAKTHQLDTVVENRRTCASMCVPIYLQGENRMAAGSSRWLFHEPRAFDFVTDEVIPSSRGETEAMTQRFLQRYFPGAGVPEPWLAMTREKMRGRDYWRSGDQLISENANIIQRRL